MCGDSEIERQEFNKNLKTNNMSKMIDKPLTNRDLMAFTGLKTKKIKITKNNNVIIEFENGSAITITIEKSKQGIISGYAEEDIKQEK